MQNNFLGRLKAGLKSFFFKIGLLYIVQGIVEWIKALVDPRYRDFYELERKHRGRFQEFKRQYGKVLGQRLKHANDGQKIALITSVHFPEVELELAVIKAIELAGYVPVVLIEREGWLLKNYYKMAAIKDAFMWWEFLEPPDLEKAKEIIQRMQSLDELLSFEFDNVRVGKYAVSTAIRKTRQGSLRLENDEERQILTNCLAASMSNTKAAERIIDKFKPDLVVIIDKGYSPKGELFDKCLLNDINTTSWDLAHKNSSIFFKRFNEENRDEQTNTISKESWQLLLDMEWKEEFGKETERELYGLYSSGDWYSVVGTQFNKKFLGGDNLKRRIGVKNGKKNAFIFPHITWDATLFWKGSLFKNYEEWLIETVRVATRNDKINWIIKIHPANVGKKAREGYLGEPDEIIIIRKNFGELPLHIKMIPADTDISTFSLYQIMDYCLTVRGTVGIEAARLGIPVLTAGRGPYDQRGFTIDSATREQYLEKLSKLYEIPPLSEEHKNLAERFAYGLFLRRVLPLTSATLEYHASGRRSASRGKINIKTKEDWYTAPDLNALAQWFNQKNVDDFLLPI